MEITIEDLRLAALKALQIRGSIFVNYKCFLKIQEVLRADDINQEETRFQNKQILAQQGIEVKDPPYFVSLDLNKVNIKLDRFAVDGLHVIQT